MKRSIVTLLLAVASISCTAMAQDAKFVSAPKASERPWDVLANSMTTYDLRLYAVKTDKAPDIDGKLDDPAWQKAFSVSAFGAEGFKGYSQRANTARFLYTDKALYVACTAELGKWSDDLARQRAHDDGVWQDEAFELFVDPGLSRKEYYQLIVNAVGSMEDHKGWDVKPNPKWKAAVSHTDKGWVAEVEIPFDSLGAAAPKDGDVWGMNVFRDDKVLKESSGISPVLDSAHDSSRFAALQFSAAPDIYLDNFNFDKVVRGDNVLKFKAYGASVKGAKLRCQVLSCADFKDAGKPVGEPTEVALVEGGVTELPFKLTTSGASKLQCEIIKDGKTIGKYGFLANVYEEHMLVLVTGGANVIKGRKQIDLRLDMRLKPEAIVGCKLDLVLKSGSKTIKTARIEQIPGVFSSCDMNIADLPTGSYTLEGTLISPAGRAIDTVSTPLNVIEGPFAGAAKLPAVPVDAAAGDVPRQFTTWGATGQDIRYRRATPDELKRMTKDGMTEERAHGEFDCRAWPEVQDPAEKPATVFTQAQKSQGYVLFTRPYVNRTFYYSVPKASEIISDVQAFAAKDQYEPITFAIHGLKELKDVKAEVSALGSKDGAVLPRECMDVRVVRSYEQSFGAPWWDPEKVEPKTRLPQKTVIPMLIEKRASIAVPQGQSRQFWITLKVPQDAKPGFYSGNIKLTIDGATALVPLHVRVLPFELVKLDKYAHMDETPVSLQAYIDFAEHGFNVIQLGLGIPNSRMGEVENAYDKFVKSKDQNARIPLPPVEEIMSFNKPRLQQAIDLAKQAKLDVRRVYFAFYGWFTCGWGHGVDWFVYYPLNAELDKHYTDCINETVAFAKERGFPPFVVIPGDEPGGHPDTLPYIKHYLEVIKQKCPGALTGVPAGGGESIGIDEADSMGPSLDVFDTNFMSVELLKKLQARKLEIWVCNVGSMTQDPRLDRYGFGYYPWKIGAKGMAQWAYKSGDPYDQVYMGNTGAATYIWPSADAGKPIPTIHWETIRQAIIDQRYGATLTKLIEIANAAGDSKAKAAAAEATDVIKDVLNQYHLGYQNRRFPDSAWRKFYIYSIDGDCFDVSRWKIAQQIIKLQDALGDKAKFDASQPVFPMAPKETMYN